MEDSWSTQILAVRVGADDGEVSVRSKAALAQGSGRRGRQTARWSYATVGYATVTYGRVG